MRPAWLLRLGLFIYDHLGGRKLLPATKTLDLAVDDGGKALKRGAFARGFEYSDARVDDSRLVVLNALAAAESGAVIRTYTKAIEARRENSGWLLTVEDRINGARQTLAARIIVNAAGPWVTDVLHKVARAKAAANVRLVQGSHIVVRRLFDHDRAYFFQNADGRIFFAIPYHGAFTLIGTTDRDYRGDAGEVRITEGEIDYLLAACAEYFDKPPARADIVWSFSGVRPLYDDGVSAAQEATRDYVLEYDETGGAPLLSIFGGKITTYRRLAEAALDKLAAHLAPEAVAKRGWTARSPLPGGEFKVTGRGELVAELRRDYSFLTASHAERLVHLYGTRARRILGSAISLADLGRDFGATLTEAELRYLVEQEWARTAEDVVWRRTKLGLRLDAKQVAAIDAHLASVRDAVAPA
jgi:glycerol-3-phosphate dehydrogenase